MTTTPSPITGLHHITAMAADAQRNLDFYVGTLGLRLVKTTVNFDDPSAYHLYYADGPGTPGTVMTFFPWQGMPRGRVGTGQASLTQFAVPEGSLAFWAARLAERGIDGARSTLFGEARLMALDPDGLPFALVEDATADVDLAWTTPDIGRDVAVRGFHGITLAPAVPGGVAPVLLDLFGYSEVGTEAVNGRTVRRYRIADAAQAGVAPIVDVEEGADLPRGLQGAGTVHHVAFNVPDDAAQRAVRAAVAQAGLGVTPQIDRDYFQAIYFRTPGGILFEVATTPPGFQTDEDFANLGTGLMLPSQHEPRRTAIEAALPPLTRPA